MSQSSCSQWSDLPRRFITVSIGAPFIVFLLSTKSTCRVFFQVVHLLCAIEWIQLSPITNVPSSLPVMNRNKTFLSTILFPFISFLVTICSNSDQVLITLSFGTALIYLSCYVDIARYGQTVEVGVRNIDKNKTKISPKYGPKCDDDMNEQKTNQLIQSISNTKYHALHGLLYISIPFYCWMRIALTSFSHTTYLLFIIWNTDTGALLAGRFSKMLTNFSSTEAVASLKHDLVGNILSKSLLGRYFIQIIIAISPSKSITGFAGGLLLGAWTAVYLPSIIFNLYDSSIGILLSLMRSYCLNFIGLNSNDDNESNNVMDISRIQPDDNRILDFDSTIIGNLFNNLVYRRTIIGLLLSICSIIGDLVESAVKRNAGKKDSGKLLPGHGGILDRFDSTFLAVVLYFICFFPRE